MKNPITIIQSRMKPHSKVEIAKRAGIAQSKIWEIANDPERDILVSTLMKLDKALTELEQEAEE